MYKISVQLPDNTTESYFTTIVPIIGDTIEIKGTYWDVAQRRLFSDNPNFVIVFVKPN